MRPIATLQSIIDPFVRGIGGELIADLIDNNKLPLNADYRFRKHNVIAELKALEVDSFGESHKRRVGRIMTEWHKKGLLRIFGTSRIETRQLPRNCQEELASVLAQPLQRIVSTANRQIESTKALPVVDMPDAKGLLWVASDGNQDLQPEMVWFLLKRILQKRHPSGAQQYSNIHALAYFNPRMLAELPGAGAPTLFWFSGARDRGDQGLQVFLRVMCDIWPQYVSWAQASGDRDSPGKRKSDPGRSQVFWRFATNTTHPDQRAVEARK